MILSLALLAGGLAFASVSLSDTHSVNTNAIVVSQEDDGYKEVDIESLSETVQAAIKTMAGDTYGVKKTEFNAEMALTRVTFLNKADQSEKVVILDKDGKEVVASDISM